MESQEIYHRIWQAPDGNAYFGIFTDRYPDHLFNVSEFLITLYQGTTPKDVSNDIDKLVVEYFLEGSSGDIDRCTEPKEMFETADPVVWFANNIMRCIVDDASLIDGYKRAMGLPIPTDRENLDRYRNLNNFKS